MRLNDVLFQSLAYRGVCTAYKLRTDDVPCDGGAFLSTDVRRCMSNHHVNATIASEITSTVQFFIQSYGRGRARIENSYRGFVVEFSPE